MKHYNALRRKKSLSMAGEAFSLNENFCSIFPFSNERNKPDTDTSSNNKGQIGNPWL
jgi:hypothetical protein